MSCNGQDSTTVIRPTPAAEAAARRQQRQRERASPRCGRHKSAVGSADGCAAVVAPEARRHFSLQSALPTLQGALMDQIHRSRVFSRDCIVAPARPRVRVVSRVKGG